jgi:hypothetical protein
MQLLPNTQSIKLPPEAMSLSSDNITGYNDNVSSTLIAAATHVFSLVKQQQQCTMW